MLHIDRSVALAIVNSESWKEAMKWHAKDDKDRQDTPMKLLIKHMPGLLKNSA